MKKAFAIAVLACSTFVGFAANAAEYNWTFQSSDQPGNTVFKTKQDWAKQVETMSGGRIHIEILPVGAVVAHNETLEAVGSGLLTGHITDSTYFAGKDPAFSLLGNMVGAWSTPYDLYRFLEYGGGDKLYNELENPYGVQFLGAATPGQEALVSKKVIRGVADLKGLKLRSPEGMIQDVFAHVGAAPVNLPHSEVYTSLDKGVIDAADASALATNDENGYNKIAKAPVYPGFHSMPTIEVAMNKAIYDGLPEDLRAILLTSVRWLSWEYVNRLESANIKVAAKLSTDPSVRIVNWPEEERIKFRQQARITWKEYAKRSAFSQKVYDQTTTWLKSQGKL
ncbi:TRAP transporter substrate-binding protein [Buttiauxella selenatireducens]|uniref:TRAP transporter substrate-binding protein n=1 Tax=Buttiauxella selenatireducens TaxID=3073902 RepID=A0ABY9S527_9ENTR|nr:TRAP transporter substrate-binding protein [Buttiauxella sp. R73]WMY72595.1 TRAP transporter substrate-binding protein [Buttiauxella sp. R73]